MSSLLRKSPPDQAELSTGHADRAAVQDRPRRRRTDRGKTILDRGSDPILKTRLQTAYAIWRAANDGNREAFADVLEISFSALKHYLSDSDPTAPPPRLVLLAEAVADASRSEKSNEELGLLLRARQLIDMELGEEWKAMRRRALYEQEEAA